MDLRSLEQQLQVERHARAEAEAELRRSEQRFRDVVENANDIVLTADLAGNFTSVNAAGERIGGYSRDEICKMNMAQFLAPEGLALAQQMLQLKLEEDRPTVYQVDVIARDGKRVPLELSTRLISHDGRPVGIQCVARDITERKRAAEALRESEQRYRALFENASDIVYTHDLRGWFTSVNAAAERVTGYKPEEIVGRTISAIVAPDQRDLARRMIQQKLDARGPTIYELDIIKKDGRRATLEINSQIIYGGGVPVGVQGMARDVTGRRQAEERLRGRERQQAALADLGQKALAATDFEALFEEAAQCISATLGVDYCSIFEFDVSENGLRSRGSAGWSLEPRHLLVPAGNGSPAGYTFQWETPLVVENLLQETRFSTPPILMEHQVRSLLCVRVDGITHAFGVLCAYSVAKRTFTQDDVHFMESTANVLTNAIQRSSMEKERAEHAKELAARVLEAQEDERKRIARELHDETAQTLSMLLTHLDLIESHVSAGNEPLRAGLRRVAELARRTLDETRALSHDLRPTILDDAGLVAALHWLAADYRSTFHMDVRVNAVEPPYALSPQVEVALFRVSQEALMNSCKHSQAQRVRLTLTPCPDSIRLLIEDNGRGFDPAKVPPPSRAGHLGLSGMRERVELLGGNLAVSARPAGGTQVNVIVPVDPGAPE